jgi:hypothetical protein
MMKKLLLLAFIAVANEAMAQDAQCVGSINHPGERGNVGLQYHQHTDQTGERDRVPEHIRQDRAFMAEPIGGGRDDDRLRIDYLCARR